MSFRNCIDRALREGAISEDQAARVREILDEEEAAARADIGGAAAETEAGRRAMARFEQEVLEAERRTRLQVAAVDRVRQRIEARTNAKGEARPRDELPDLVEHHGSSPNPSVAGRYRAILGRAHARMTEAIFRFERDLLTRTRNRAQLRNVVREAFGENSGDAAARAMAQGWRDAAEFLRRRFNAAGGSIRKLDDWGLPQSHDAIAIRRAGFDAWRDEIMPRLDRAKMLDDATGRPLSDERLADLLRETYDAIISRGWSRRQPSQRGSAGSMARRHDARRVLAFRSADDWMSYAERFGEGDAFSAMMGHLDRMSREVGAMEVLGPNPDATLNYARQLATKIETLNNRRAGADIGRLMDDMWAIHTGTAMAAQDSTFARVMGTAQNIKVSANLGGAALSALTDDAYHRIARGMVGLSEASGMSEVMRMFNPASGADRQAAVRSGLIAEGAAQVMSGQARYVNEFSSFEFSRRMADVTLRASGLSPMTQGRRWAFGMEFMGHIADNFDKGFDNLPRALRETLQRYGFDASDWAALRSVDLYEPRPGARILRPEDVAASSAIEPPRADDLANRLLEMVGSETDFAVPVATLRARATLGAGHRGLPLIEFVTRSFAMYKSFPVSVLMLYGGRSWQVSAQAGAVMGAKLAAKATIYTTLLGALALQMKEVTKGRDPRPMDTMEFWQASLLQGGGLGIFGDFLFSDLNRFGGGLESTLAGPLGQEAGNIFDFTFGNAQEAMQGEDMNFGRESVDLLRRNTPGGSVWYLRLAYERLLLDQLQAEVDPDAGARWRRFERRYRRDYDQEYWWAPGETAPERPPDAGNALPSR